MDLTVSDADIEVLASQLQVVMDDAYRQGQQAECERLRQKVSEIIRLEDFDDVMNVFHD